MTRMTQRKKDLDSCSASPCDSPTGTTVAEISKQNFRPIPVVLPPKELMAASTTKVAPHYAQITANLHQSHTLATLRDTLLPKLLSGELSVAEATIRNCRIVQNQRR